jgi:hypothetical protein
MIRLADDSADAPLTASNLTASGTLAATGLATLSGGVSTNFIDSTITAGTGVRESIFRARVSDASNDAFHIYNATIVDGAFAPGFSGSRFSSNGFALLFAGQTTTANDNGTSPLVYFQARITGSTTDPNNSAFTSVVTRPLFGWYKGDNTSVGQVSAAGQWALNASISSSSTTTGTLVVTGGVGISGNTNIGGTTTATGGLVLGSFTAAAFPSTTYLMGVVTDALAPVVGASVAGGGSAKCIVCYNGTSKIVTALL